MNKAKDTFSQIWDELDKPLILPLLLFFSIAIIAAIMNPEGSQATYSGIINWLAFNANWAYVGGACATILLLLWCCLGKEGHVKLGRPEDTPELSTLSWLSMMFGASIGMSILLAGTTEPVMYLNNSLWLKDAGTEGTGAGILDAVNLGLFHYGATAWGLYALAGLAIAIPAFRLNKPLTLSTGLYGIFKDKVDNSVLAWATNMLGLITSIGGIAAGLGLGMTSVVYAFNKFFGIELTTGLQLVGVVILSGCFTASAVSGLQRGLKWVSNANMIMFVLIMLFVLLAGPTLQILNSVIQLAGTYISSFVEMQFFTDAAGYKDGEWAQRPWINWWTVMYWMWFVAYMPFVGGFLARISRGRTIREYILGSVFLPTAFVWLVMGIFGTSACSMDIAGTVDLYSFSKESYAAPLYEMLAAFPMGLLFSFVALISTVLFGISTYDSAAFFIAMQTTKGNLNPSILIRLVWGLALGTLAVLLVTSGGLQAAKKLGLLAGSFFFVVLVGYLISVIRMMGMINKKKM